MGPLASGFSPLNVSKIQTKEGDTTEKLFMISGSSTAASAAAPQRNSSGRELAEALRESEERYQLLLDGIQNYAIFMWTRRAGSSVGMRGPNESKVTHPIRLLVITFPASFRRTGPS
jgi:hypothetical protein